MQPSIDTLCKRRDIALEVLGDAILCVKPQGAFYLFLDVRPYLNAQSTGPNRDALSLSVWLLEKHLLAMVPGEAFASPGFLRLSYAVDTETLKLGLTKLKEALLEARDM